jgi:PAS domain S-box-containing protein
MARQRQRAPGHQDPLQAELASLRQQVAALEAAQRRQAKTARRASAPCFRAVVEHSSDALALLSADGMLLYVSPSITRMLGYAVADLVGQSGFALVHPEDQDSARTLFGQLLQDPGATVTGRVRVRHQNGSWRWVESVGTNLLEQPDVRAIVANYRDVTTRRQIEEAARKALQEEARLEGVLLAARELADRMNNNLALALATIDVLEHRLQLPVDLTRMVGNAGLRLRAIVQDLERLCQVVRVETKQTPIGPALDLDKSSP